jgi:hypothetical protein
MPARKKAPVETPSAAPSAAPDSQNEVDTWTHRANETKRVLARAKSEHRARAVRAKTLARNAEVLFEARKLLRAVAAGAVITPDVAHEAADLLGPVLDDLQKRARQAEERRQKSHTEVEQAAVVAKAAEADAAVMAPLVAHPPPTPAN